VSLAPSKSAAWRHWAVGQSNGCCQLHRLQFLNHRHCSECQGSARAEWLAKGVVYSIRFTAAAETLRIIVADPKHLGAEIGLAAHLATEPGSPRMSCRLAGHLPAGPAGSGAVSDSLCR
jgi:hypothetical protein